MWHIYRNGHRWKGFQVWHIYKKVANGNTSKGDVFTKMVTDGRDSKHDIFIEKLLMETLPSMTYLQKRAKGLRWDWVSPDRYLVKVWAEGWKMLDNAWNWVKNSLKWLRNAQRCAVGLGNNCGWLRSDSERLNIPDKRHRAQEMSTETQKGAESRMIWQLLLKLELLEDNTHAWHKLWWLR